MANTPYWTYDGTAYPQVWIGKADVLAVQSDPVVTNGVVFSQTGFAQTNEIFGATAQHFQPFGIHGIPVVSTVGQPGTEFLYWERGDELFSFAGRDTTNQMKAGTVNPGEIAVYAPGANGINRVYLDINGNAFISVQNDINLQAQQDISINATNDLTLTSQANLVTVNSSTINLGSASAAFTAALSQLTDADFQVVSAAATIAATATAAVTPTPIEAGAIQLKALLMVFFSSINSFNTTASTVVKMSG